MGKVQQLSSEYALKHKRKKRWQKIVTVMAAVVVFCTTYALILPAITMEKQTICNKEEHTHTSSCYSQSENIMICTENIHQHTSACIDASCGYADFVVHEHDELCYDEAGTLRCMLEEIVGHVHSDECYAANAEDYEVNAEDEAIEATSEPVFDEPESDDEEAEFEITLTDKSDFAESDGQLKLICNKMALHTHSSDCRDGAGNLVCGMLELKRHVHTEECFNQENSAQTLICTKEEHTHDDACYNNPDADTETKEEWEATIPKDLTGIWQDDIIAVAESQIGYEESDTNVIVDTEGKIKGYTRYGDWYGSRYSSWCAMFASFCLNYAGIDSENFPYEASCYRYIMELQSLDLYREAESTYTPNKGDLIFFDMNEDSKSDHVGIVKEVITDEATQKTTVHTIEGNTDKSVEEHSYDITDSDIIGYGDITKAYETYKAKREVKVYSGGDYTVNVMYDKDALPENAVLTVRELDKESEEYALYCNEMLASLNDSGKEMSFLRLFDISFTVDGNEVEPTTPVEINISYDDGIEIAGKEEIKGVHFKDDEELEILDATSESDTSDTQISEFNFTLKSFSIAGTAVVYDVSTAAADTPLATTSTYSSSIFKTSRSYIIYVTSGSNYYAINGSGGRAQITIENGYIYSDLEDPSTILWKITPTSTTNSYTIQNVSTGRYLYPSSSGVTTTTASNSTLSSSSGGARIYGGRYARYYNNAFTTTTSQSSGTAFSFGVSVDEEFTVWLDGTNGGIMSLLGSGVDEIDKAYTVKGGEEFTLPLTWQSPYKYDYTLRGWYDITNSKYYAPGSKFVPTGDTVFYADYVATSYDVGQFNEFVSDTVSTNDFITTRVFDYSTIFNMQSEKLHSDSYVNSSAHYEKWQHLESGTVPYENRESLNFIFIDWDRSSEDISYPVDKNNENDNGEIDEGIYTEQLGELLFGTDNSYDPQTNTGVVGKQYIGEADHLFHYMKDSTDDYYGYYYYDSKLNAASYNQSDERFYVYDYLERTSDSDKDGGAGQYSDFLPFNSPYKNGNSRNQVTYTYNGEKGEYVGTTHYEYDAKYDGQYSEKDNSGTNYWFGMSIDIDFYLPNDTGSIDANGNYGNQSIQGKDMTFEFSGDDDVWVFIDGELMMDIGGVHGIESGVMNASTGQIIINGEVDTEASATFTEKVKAGQHVLTFYYLERGGSQSNCSIYFNLTPRYTFEITKEDLTTQELLNGAQFTVYDDIECTDEAELWVSKESYDSGDEPMSTFTVEYGKATFWGMSAGRSYYMKETKAPDGDGFSCSHGIICIHLDNRGESYYSVEIVEDPDAIVGEGESNPTEGFTAYGFKIDYEAQEAYLVITNPRNIDELVKIGVYKKWADSGVKDHSGDTATVYLVATKADGTRTRIREIELNSANDWKYTWENLPKYDTDGVTEIVYTVEEAQFPGYQGTIVKTSERTVETVEWDDTTNSLSGGNSYLLKTGSGYLATVSAADAKLTFISDEETAKQSSTALWTVTSNSSGITLTNGEGQILTFNYSSSSSSRYFYATTSSTNYQTLTFASGRLYYRYSSYRTYYPTSTLSTTGRLSTTTTASSSLSITPVEKRVTTVTEEIDYDYYELTNAPVEEQTSLTVTKAWDTGLDDGDTSLYEKLEATMRLYANGVDTGMSVVLNLRNGWTATFEGLPYEDADGQPIQYTVVEDDISIDWIAEYGEIVTIDTTTPDSYQTTVTNLYRWNHDYELPETGGSGTHMYTLGGLLLSAAAIILLYRKKKREKEDY